MYCTDLVKIKSISTLDNLYNKYPYKLTFVTGSAISTKREFNEILRVLSPSDFRSLFKKVRHQDGEDASPNIWYHIAMAADIVDRYDYTSEKKGRFIKALQRGVKRCKLDQKPNIKEALNGKKMRLPIYLMGYYTLTKY